MTTDATLTRYTAETEFTEEEAKGKIGKAVRTLRAFYRVPKGTAAKVVDVLQVGRHWDVMIKWDLPDSRTDGFTKEEYNSFLLEKAVAF